MKCDELQRHSISGVMYNGEEICGGFAYYDSDEVDEAIAELKEQLESEKASRYAESVDAGMRERRLRRALYKACANWAICEIDYWRKCLEHVGDYFDVRTGRDLDVKRCEKMIRNWINSKSKCIKKAEEYK